LKIFHLATLEQIAACWKFSRIFKSKKCRRMSFKSPFVPIIFSIKRPFCFNDPSVLKKDAGLKFSKRGK
jgi:hypothetical protein